MHSHDHIQILYASAGVMSVRTPEMSFVIPPQRAVWLPAGTRHEVACRGPVSLRTLYLPCAGHEHERQCRVFAVSNPVQSLILEVVAFPGLSEVDWREGRMLALLLHEVGRMPT